MSFGADDFSGRANGTALQSAPASDGGSWTKHPNSHSSDVVIQTGRARGTQNSYRKYTHSAAPAGPEYDVQVDVYVAGSSPSNRTGVCARQDTVADTGYEALWSPATSAYLLQQTIAGVSTVLASGVPTAEVPGETRVVKLEIRDAAKRMLVDGVEVASSSDDTITAAGRAGLVHQGFAGASSNHHLDNWSATDAGGGGDPDPTNVAFAGTAPLPALVATVGVAAPGFPASFAGTAPLPSLSASLSRTVPAFGAAFAGTAPLPTLAAAVGHVPPGQNVAFAAAAPLPVLAATLERTLPGSTVQFAGAAPLPVLVADLTRTVPTFGVGFAGVAPLPTLAAGLFNGEYAPTLYLSAEPVRLVPALDGRADMVPALSGRATLKPRS